MTYDPFAFLETPKLDLLWSDLLGQWHELHKTGYSLAAPFCSAAHQSYAGYEHRLLFVGRATKGPYALAEFQDGVPSEPAVLLHELKTVNRHIVTFHPKNSPFWRIFKAESNACGLTDHCENAVWSNVGRIGYVDKDIDSELYSKQEGVASKLLSSELEAYQPTVVHFATGTLGSNTVLSATNSSESDWLKSPEDGLEENVWSLVSGDTLYLWTRHPNRAPKTQTENWRAQLIKHIDC